MIDMSKWTDIRDSIEQAVSDTQIDEQVKQAVTQQCYDMILPSLRKLGDGFVDAIKAQSADESGWCKVRDAIVLPSTVCLYAGIEGIILRRKAAFLDDFALAVDVASLEAVGPRLAALASPYSCHNKNLLLSMLCRWFVV